jgi:hypothetical protein
MSVPCSFFNNSGYKEYLENAVAFNRKLNEERKMRLPYIDGQVTILPKVTTVGRQKIVITNRCNSLHFVTFFGRTRF